MGLSRLTHGIQQGFMHGKRFLGQAYTDGKKFLSHLDNYAGIARGVIGAVAPVASSVARSAPLRVGPSPPHSCVSYGPALPALTATSDA